MTSLKLDVAELLVSGLAGWRAWLEAAPIDHAGVWLVLHKKGGDVTSLTYEQAVDEALCFGWIDGQRRSRDEASFSQRYTPRRSRSPWSAINVTRVGGLIEAGRMTARGLAEVERARADGRWDAAYAGQRDAAPPADLLAALAADPTALATYEALSGTHRYAIFYRLQSVKRAETRARKLAGYVEALAEGRNPVA